MQNCALDTEDYNKWIQHHLLANFKWNFSLMQLTCWNIMYYTCHNLIIIIKFHEQMEWNQVFTKIGGGLV